MNVLTLWGLAQDVAAGVAGGLLVLMLWRGLAVLWQAWGLEEEIPDPERQIVPGTWVLTEGEDS